MDTLLGEQSFKKQKSNKTELLWSTALWQWLEKLCVSPSWTARWLVGSWGKVCLCRSPVLWALRSCSKKHTSIPGLIKSMCPGREGGILHRNGEAGKEMEKVQLIQINTQWLTVASNSNHWGSYYLNTDLLLFKWNKFPSVEDEISDYILIWRLLQCYQDQFLH